MIAFLYQRSSIAIVHQSYVHGSGDQCRGAISGRPYTGCRHCLLQNIYRRLSCPSRRASFLLTTRPKFALVGSTVVNPDVVVEPAMLLQFGRLMKLKISARNCSRCVPARRKFLKNAMSHCCSDGLSQSFPGALPKVPAAGAANAAGLNQKF